LVGIGEEEGSRWPVLKIWDLTREDKKRVGGGPVLMRNVRIQHGQRPHPVSRLAAGRPDIDVLGLVHGNHNESITPRNRPRGRYSLAV
jgi:hypothetical protein